MKRLALMLVLSVAVTASAQELNLAAVSTARPHVVHLSTGLDHGFTATLGYDYAAPVAGRVLLAGAEVTVPWAQLDPRDFQLRLTAALPVLQRGGWKLSARLAPTLRGADNALANMLSLGLDARVTGGWYGQHLFVAGQLGVDWVAVTHITNSDDYRARVYPEARDGWYRAQGGTLSAALLGGLSFGPWGVTVRAGVPRGLDFGEHTIPFFAQVGASYALPL